VFILPLIFVCCCFKGIAKSRYVPFKRPKEMTPADYDLLPPKNNWTPEVKKNNSSILIGSDQPPVTLLHFVVGVVHALKAYGQYGQLTKRYDMGCKVINYGLSLTRVVVHHKKLGGQHLRLLNREMLQTWIETLCNNFSGNDNNRYFQGDGNAPVEIARDGASGGAPAPAFTDGSVSTADQLFTYHLYNIKAQKQAGLHLTSEDNRAKEIQHNN
jgi:hypothetical protein